MDINAADPAGHIGTQGDPFAGRRQMTITDLDVLTDPVHTKSVRISAGLDDDAVIMTADMATPHQDSITGVNINAVGTGTQVAGNRDMIDQNIRGIVEMDIPEAGTFAVKIS